MDSKGNMNMDIKARITEVLRVPVTAAQAEVIKQNYPNFYESPESFIGDDFLPVIMDDIEVSRASSLKDLMNTVAGMSIEHSDPLHTLLWGSYKDTFLYAVPVNGQAVEELRKFDTEMGMGNAGKDELVAEVMFSNDNEAALVVVRSCEAIHAVGELPFTISEAMPGYVKGFSRRLFHGALPDALATYYVPFIPSGNGKLPVMWVDHATGHITGDDFGNELAGEHQDIKVGVYEEHFKDMYDAIKVKYPSVDLNADSKNRYTMFSHGQYNFIYNRNHLAYNGNLHKSRCIMPLIVTFMLDIDQLQTNVADVVCGLQDWSSLYYRRVSESDRVDHRVETVGYDAEHNSEVAATARGEKSAYQDTADERGEGNRKSVLGKMFDNATSDYKQV